MPVFMLSKIDAGDERGAEAYVHNEAKRVAGADLRQYVLWEIGRADPKSEESDLCQTGSQSI
ncbi:hypothetical protein BAT02nite_11640 [Bacillus atrophaeus]|nr:hypothetical protein BAT02nite_11640 [Bacillus atrophaeus]